MISVDTNILVRLVTKDDPAQTKQAANVMSGEPVLISKTVLLESEWVLRYSYGLPRDAIARSLRGVLGLPGVESDDPAPVARAIGFYEQGMDFADALHLTASAKVTKFVTFDLDLCKMARRVKSPINVARPS